MVRVFRSSRSRSWLTLVGALRQNDAVLRKAIADTDLLMYMLCVSEVRITVSRPSPFPFPFSYPHPQHLYARQNAPAVRRRRSLTKAMSVRPDRTLTSPAIVHAYLAVRRGSASATRRSALLPSASTSLCRPSEPRGVP